MAEDKLRGNLFQAATKAFDIQNPTQALINLLQTTGDLLEVERVALYEIDDTGNGFVPRFAQGIAMSELGRVASSSDHKILQSVFSKNQATTTNGETGSLGLPLAPGLVACAPCRISGQTIGLLFTGRDKDKAFTDTELATLEVLAARAAEVFTHARQTASQSYLFHKLSLLYQATHAITGTRDRNEAVKQTAAHLLKAISADECEIFIFDEGNGETQRFRQQLGKTMQQKVVPISSDKMPDYPIHKKVLDNLRSETISLTPPKGSAKDIAMLEAESLFASVIFPLAAGSEAIGLVRLLFSQSGHKINEQEIELAQAIINIGAVGLQDAIHFETAESRATQLQTLGEIGREMTSTLDLEAALQKAMEHTHNLIKAEAVVLFLMDETGDKLILKASGGTRLRIRDVAIRLEEGIAGWVTRNNTPLIVNDVRTNPLYHSAIDGQTGLLTTSVLCVPLEQRGEVLGVIEAINHPRGNFAESDQSLLLSVASWAAVAIDNANLFQNVTEARTRLESTLVETADAVVLTNTTGHIILVNQAAGQAFRINPELAVDRLASEIFIGHPLGEMLMDEDANLPTSLEITTPMERVLYATISEITNVGRVAVMQDITALKQIDRMRSQLLGTAAHDLKNPLNAIRLGADLLNDAELNEQQRKALNMMQRATDSMTNLITGLLETIRVESTSNFPYEPFQITDLIRRAIEDLRPLSDARKQKVIYKPPDDSVLISGDPNRLNSVMANLISNAIKFSPEGAKIEINLRWDDEEVIVSVADNGPGIPEDEIPRIFEHLFRGRITVQDPSNPIDGTGLGLALAKTVIEQHGGRIWVRSKEDEGSTFSFSLPRESTPKTGSLKKEKEG
jgi:two-component system phosphate regulon sensor histidine kinase PhoR